MRLFRKKHPSDALSVDKLFPKLNRKPREIKLHFGIGEAIIGVIAGALSSIGLTGTAAAVTAVGSTLLSVFSSVLTMAISMVVSTIFNKDAPDRSVQQNGRMFNTKSTTEPVRLIYGIIKTGGNWVYCDPSKRVNKQNNIAVTWGEGEIEGVGYDIDEKPRYQVASGVVGGEQLNDMIIGGVYTGVTDVRFKVLIDTVGANDTFEWYVDDVVQATGITISDTWHELTGYGVTVRFGHKTGHRHNDYWTFNAGTAIYFNDTLAHFYEDYDPSPQQINHHNLVKYKNLHTGTATQTVDEDLMQNEVLWRDPLHYTAYSTFGLWWHDTAWQSIPEFRAVLKGLKVYDTRSTKTDWHITTDALAMTIDASASTFTRAAGSFITDGFVAGMAFDSTGFTTTANNTRKIIQTVVALTITVTDNTGLVDEVGGGDEVLENQIGRNPALVWYDLMTNARYGLGISSARIDADSVSDAANWCEQNNYYLDTVICDRDDLANHIEDLLKNFRGYVVRSNGTYKLKVYTDDASVMTLTDADLEISNDDAINIPGIPETPNKVNCTFIDRRKHWAVNYADYYEDAVLTADSNIERTSEITLTGTIGYEQAKKLAKFYYLRGRYNRTFSLLCHPRVLALEEGDMVTIVSDFYEWSVADATKVRLLSRGIPQNGLVPCVFQEESSTIYDQTVNVVDDDEIWTSSQTDAVADQPTELTVGATGLDESTARDKKDTYQELSWHNDNSQGNNGIDYILQYRKDGTEKWTNIKITDPVEEADVTQRIGKLAASTTFNWRVRMQIGKSLSVWADGTDFTTYSPALPNHEERRTTSHEAIQSTDLPDIDGSIGYIADQIELQDCDDSTEWTSTSAVSGSIVLSTNTDATYVKKGTGSLKVELWRYPKVESEETGTLAVAVGMYASDTKSHTFTKTGNHTIAAIAVEVKKVGTPPSALTLHVHRVSDETLMGSATIAAASVPTTWSSEPARYIYGVAGAAFALADTISYRLDVETASANTSNYYQVKASSSGPPIYTYNPNYRLGVAGDADEKYISCDLGAGGVQNISAKSYLRIWSNSSRAAAFFQFAMGEAAISDLDASLGTLTVSTANTWQQLSTDISAIAAGSRDAIRYVGIKVKDMSADAILYLDDYYANVDWPAYKYRRGTTGEGGAIETILTDANVTSFLEVFSDPEDQYEFYEDFTSCHQHYNSLDVNALNYVSCENTWESTFDNVSPAYTVVASNQGRSGVIQMKGDGTNVPCMRPAGSNTSLPYVSSKNPTIEVMEAQYGTTAAIIRYMGIADGDLTGPPTNGIYFRHDDTGHYIAVARKTGSESTVDTAVHAANGTFHKLKLVVNGTTAISVYIDGTDAGDITGANLPTANLYYSQGSTSTSTTNGLYVDYVRILQDR